RLRHLPFRRDLQQFIVLPDRAGHASAVANIVEVDNDDRKDAHSMETLLNFELRGIQNRAQLKTFDLRLPIPEQAIRHESNFPGRDVEAEFVSPCSKRLQKDGLPAPQLDIRNGREARIEHPLEIEDLLEMVGLEPWR